MISSLDRYIYSLVKVLHWWSLNHDCVFFLFMHSLFTYMETLWLQKKLQFPNNKLLCSFVYFLYISLPQYSWISRRDNSPETLYDWLETILWCWISCLELKRCRIITLTYALNEVVTILEVWVQKTATLVQKWTAKISEPISLWSPDTKFQLLRGCISFCLLFIQFFWLSNFFKISCCQTIR